MGLRFRKSINLGGGFRINLSKSGVGYSWGTKGIRVTKTARGTKKRTYSIPGTGISWVDESGGRKKKGNKRSNKSFSSKQQFQQNYDSNLTKTIESADITQFKEAEEGAVSDAIERVIRIDWIGKVFLWGFLFIGVNPIFLLFPILGVALIILAHTRNRVNLEYTFDTAKQDEYNGRIAAWQLLMESDKKWQVLSETLISNMKVNAGAGSNVKRVPCVIKKGKPF